ncbi:60S ribosomal protein L31 [Abeliophyllum distichum]|uniref:60S ribosomal protein L31 n=1 Tax=Abeliophyllum distichum TaxID=126358 RepID=A0ABD1U384_9LAMI
MVEKGSKARKEEIVAREYTINLHKWLHRCTFNKKAPKVIKEIKKFAQKAMGTTNLWKLYWHLGKFESIWDESFVVNVIKVVDGGSGFEFDCSGSGAVIRRVVVVVEGNW